MIVRVMICLIFYILGTKASLDEESLQSPPELHYDLFIHSQGKVLANQRLSIIYSKKYFQSYKDRLSVQLSFPTSQLPFAELVVSFKNNHPGQSRITSKKWKLTKSMIQIKKFNGIEQLFGIKSIGLNPLSQKKVLDYATNKAYLKILYNQSVINSKSHGSQSFFIDQNEIAQRQSYIPLQLITQQSSFTLKIVPQLFTKGQLYKLITPEKSIKQNGINLFEYIEEYYLNLTSKNKTSFNQQIQFLRNIYYKLIQNAQNQILRLQQSGPAETRKVYLQKALQLTIINYKKQLINIEIIEEQMLMFGEQTMQLMKQYIIILWQIVIQVGEIIKKVIFFNQNGYYTYMLIAVVSSFILNNFVKGLFILNILWLAVHYKKHGGLSFIVFYIQIFTFLFDYLHFQMLPWPHIIFIIPFALLFIHRSDNLPYFTFRAEDNYKKHLPIQKNMVVIISSIIFVLFLGAYLFYRVLLFGNQAKNQKNAYQIYSNIYTQYYFMFILMGQVYLNHKLKTVKHLTKWYLFFVIILVLSDNFLIFLNVNPINIIMKLKQDIIVCILIHQILIFQDLGKQNTLEDTNQAINQAYKKRERQLLAMIEKDE